MAKGMKVDMSADRAKVTITLTPEGEEIDGLDLNPHQLLTLIRQLGRMYQTMNEGKPVPALAGQNVDAIFGPSWFVQPEIMGEASAISFYHPAFGPLGFVIPIAQVEHLVDLLSTQVAAAKSDRGTPQ